MSNNQSIMQKNEYAININMSFVIKNLVYALLFILFFFALGQVAKFHYGFDHLLGFVPMFNLYEEANLPTWFSSFILLASAILLLIIATEKRVRRDRYFIHWAILSAVFLFLSIDESAKLHEAIGGMFKRVVGQFLMAGNWSMWVVPFGVLVLLFAGAYVRFLFSLKPYFRNLFVLAGCIYVFGALGMEVAEILYLRGLDAKTEIFMVMVTIEEVMEIGGIILFIYGLLRYIQENVGKFSVEFKT